ncbi:MULTISPECIES: helix-turn-helix domain-containing protein [unclassified Curtobacterium]|uniref:AraC family transcriptional regulator n=1 Tax=unclassified Curtobacterium TaxID=257496 RepID=UPI0038190139
MGAALVERTKSVAETKSLVVAAELISESYSTLGLQVTVGEEPFFFERTITGTSLLSLESTRCSGTVRGELDSDGKVIVAWLKAGRASIDGDVLRVGTPKLYRAGRQDILWENFQKDAMRLDRDLVERVAAERGGWTPAPLEFKPHHVPDGAPLAAWWLMVRSVAPEILGAAGKVSASRERELARIAAAGLLTAIPHWPVGQSKAPLAQTRLARAEAFVLEHVTDPISVADVAASVGLSVRGLQSAFQRVHGMSPSAYLRGVRLMLAHERLQSGDADSVAAVIQSVRGGHLGRFAAAYRAAFGQLPSQTLRSSSL